VEAGRQNDRQRNHHKDMRPIMFQKFPRCTPRAGRPSINVNRSG
jgi:hypothetical protein